MGEPFRVLQGDSDVSRAVMFSEHRRRFGLSQRQAADALGLDLRDLEALESGSGYLASNADYVRAVNVLERAVGGSL